MHHLLVPICLLLSFLIPVSPMPEPDPAGLTTNIIFSSADYGATWQDISAGLPANTDPRSFWSNGRDYLLSTENTLYRSRAAGPTRTWEQEHMMQQDFVGIFPGKAAPYAVSRWYGFWQYEPFLGIWFPKHQALKDKLVYTFLEGHDGKLFAGCETGLYRSTDNGKSWEKVLDEGVVLQVREAEGVLMACSRGTLFRSTDGGAQWEQVFREQGIAFHVETTDQGWFAIVSNPPQGGARSPRSLFVSTDQGKSWKPMYRHLPALLGGISDIRQAGDYLFACADVGIVRSSDGGLSWQPAYLIPAGEGLSFSMKVFEDSLFAMLVARGGNGC